MTINLGRITATVDGDHLTGEAVRMRGRKLDAALDREVQRRAATKPFEYPETCDYQAAHAVWKTRKLPDGRFEACGALYFMGKRCTQLYAVGMTRGRVINYIDRALESNHERIALMTHGLVSYGPAVIA